jgi:hypothetical protein
MRSTAQNTCESVLTLLLYGYNTIRIPTYRRHLLHQTFPRPRLATALYSNDTHTHKRDGRTPTLRCMHEGLTRYPPFLRSIFIRQSYFLWLEIQRASKGSKCTAARVVMSVTDECSSDNGSLLTLRETSKMIANTYMYIHLCTGVALWPHHLHHLAS